MLNKESEIVNNFFSRYTPSCGSYWKNINRDLVTVEQILEHAKGKHAGFFGYSGKNTRGVLIKNFGVNISTDSVETVKQKLNIMG